MNRTTTLDAPTPSPGDGLAFVKEVEQLGRNLERVRDGVGRMIFGQQEVVDQTLVTVLAGGHALLLGVAGLAQTRPGAAPGTTLGPGHNPISFPPDPLPAHPPRPDWSPATGSPASRRSSSSAATWSGCVMASAG